MMTDPQSTRIAREQSPGLLCRLGFHRWQEDICPIELSRWPHEYSWMPFEKAFLRIADDGKTWVMDFGHMCRDCRRRRP